MKNIFQRQNFFLGFIVFWLSFACATPATKEESSTSVADTTPPTVSAVSPADGVSGIALNSSIALTFSKGIEPFYISTTTNESCTGSIQISTDGFNTCIPATTEYDSSRKIYTLTPGTSAATQNLETSATHQVRVTTDVKDYFGFALTDNHTTTGFSTVSVCASSCSWGNNSASGLTAGSGHGTAVHLGKMWSMGGYDGSSTNNKVFSSSDGKTWTSVTDNATWLPRNNHAVTAFDGKLWVIGGMADQVRFNDVWSSSDGKTWTPVTLTAEWEVREGHSVQVFKGKMFLIGGISSSGNMNDIWSSSDGKTWDNVTNSANWSTRSEFAAAVFKNKLWVLGGNDGSNDDLQDVWSSSDGKTWTEETTSNIWAIRKGHTTAVFDNKLWVIGGNSGSGTISYWNSVDGITWSNTSVVLGNVASRSGSSAEALGNRLYLIGGYDGSYYDQVFKYGP